MPYADTWLLARLLNLAMLTAALAAGVMRPETAQAQLLSTLFPDGVPGYGSAPGVTVLSRARPAFAPPGLRAGSLILHPLLLESFGFDSAPPVGGPSGSWEVITQPSLAVTSDWSRDAIGAFLSASDTGYLSRQTRHTTDGTVSVGGAVDIGRDQLTLGAAHLSRHEDQTQLAALASDSPIVFRVDDVRASYAATFGRWTATPAFEAASWQYGDATVMSIPVSQSYRDRTTLQGGLTLRYEWAPLRNLVLVTRALGQHYIRLTPGQAQEDSTGYQMLAGFDDDQDAIWRYRLLMGVETRQFADSAVPSHTGLIAEAQVIWSPSALTTISATLSRRLEDAAQEGVAGFTYTGATLSIDHECLRNLLLNLSGGAQHAAFLQSGGEQVAYTMGIELTWLMNRSIRVSATYGLAALRNTQMPASASVSGDTTRSLALLNLRFGL